MARYKIKIDTENCVGDKLCCEKAPATFALGEDEKIRIVDPAGDPPEDILAAAQCCPFEGIFLYDASTGAQVWPRI